MDATVILGAGLAGLSAAHFLQGPWHLVEKSERVGGLIKTEVVQGCAFDATGHWLHLRDPEIQALVEGLWLPGATVRLQRKAAIFSRGVFTRFPYQVNTHGLPAEVVAENVLGFVEALYGEGGKALRSREPRHFEEFVLRHLGAGFAQNFMLPYNRKLWTVPLSELSAEWVGRFVPRPTLKEVVDGALGVGSDSLGYNASFLYPKEGGIESWAKAMRAHLKGGIVSLQCEPLSLNWKTRRLHLSDGRQLSYGGLISTVALPHLVKLLAQGESGVPEGVREAAGRLRATTVTYVQVAVKGKNRQPWHWIYLPEPAFKAYRIGSPSAVYPPLAPEGTSTFYVEYSHQGELTLETCEREAAEDLLRSQMIHSRDDLLFAKAREIPHAYVLYDAAYGAAKAEILSFLKHAGILTAGRYGQWEYSSMEDAVLAGRACARQLEP